MKILIIKLSSLGDVLHNLPIVWDLRSKYPDAQIDWLVEEGYVHLILPLQSSNSFKGVDRIIPLGLRRWKKELRQGKVSKVIDEFQSFKSQLQQISYDILIETQGLLKAAVITSLAKKKPGAVIAGIGNRTEGSGYEPLSRLFYSKSVVVPIHCHTVDRSRAVAASAINYPPPMRDGYSETDPFFPGPYFYPKAFTEQLKKQENPLGLLPQRYVLCFHATARVAKSWDAANWVQTGNFLAKRDLQVVLPWGSPGEKEISESLARHIPGAIVPRAFSIEEAFPLIAQAKMTIGVDTGLTHLSAILNRPTVEIYVDSPIWKTEGYWSPFIKNLGDTEKPPTSEQMILTLQQLFEKLI